MKDWLALHYPDIKATYDQLRRRVQEAWESIGEEVLDQLIDCHEMGETVANRLDC